MVAVVVVDGVCPAFQKDDVIGGGHNPAAGGHELFRILMSAC